MTRRRYPTCRPGTCTDCDRRYQCPTCRARWTCATTCRCCQGCGAARPSACLCRAEVPVVAVCGGRDYPHQDKVWSALDALHDVLGPFRVVTGDAAGVDHHTHTWALARGVPCLRVRADWARHGKAAGGLRNQQILDTHRPDHLIAYPGGPGTADMRQRAETAGIPVHTTTRPDHLAQQGATHQ